ncbi:oxalate/formate antiporter family transporter [compost metagenome]
MALRWLHDQGPQQAAGIVTEGERSGVSFTVGICTPAFWFLALSLVLVILGIWAMLISIMPMLQDKGLSSSTASRIFGTYGVALILGRLLVGFLMDRWWAPGVACITLAMPALGCLIFLFAEPSIAAMAVATMLVGIGVGAEIDVAAFLVARYFGLRDYPRLFGLLMALLAGGGCFAPYAFGELYDATNSYEPMLWICTVVFTIGPLTLLCMGRYPDLGSASSACQPDVVPKSDPAC